jgi:hypothetical protein
MAAVLSFLFNGGPFNLLTTNVTRTQVRSPRRTGARAVKISSAPETEGVGNAGCPMHPQPRVRYGS